MKRLTQTLLLSLLMSIQVFSQDTNSGYIKGTGTTTSSRQTEWECAPGSIFSQAPLNEWSAWYCDANDSYQYTEVIDDYSLLSGNINKVTIWVGYYDRIYGTCTPVSPLTDTYQINFYDINGTDPDYPGALAQSFTLSPTLLQYAGSGISDIYRVEFTLPSSVSLSTGWLGISRLTRQDNCIVMWYIIMPGGNGITGKQRHEGVLEDTGTEFAFCLEGGSAPVSVVPVGNWSIILAGIFIAVAMVIRYLRIR